MTHAQELRIINHLDEIFKNHNLNDKNYLFPKDIQKAFGYSRQMLDSWCKDEKKALDYVWHTPNKRKYPVNEFRKFLIRLNTKGEY